MIKENKIILIALNSYKIEKEKKYLKVKYDVKYLDLGFDVDVDANIEGSIDIEKFK